MARGCRVALRAPDLLAPGSARPGEPNAHRPAPPKPTYPAPAPAYRRCTAVSAAATNPHQCVAIRGSSARATSIATRRPAVTADAPRDLDELHPQDPSSRARRCPPRCPHSCCVHHRARGTTSSVAARISASYRCPNPSATAGTSRHNRILNRAPARERGPELAGRRLAGADGGQCALTGLVHRQPAIEGGELESAARRS